MILYFPSPKIHNKSKASELSKTAFGKAEIEQKSFRNKKQPLRVFYQKGVLNNLAKFTRKHLCQNLFSIVLPMFLGSMEREQV